MKTFKVLVKRAINEYLEVEVEAKNRDQAKALAIPASQCWSWGSWKDDSVDYKVDARTLKEVKNG